MAKRVLTLQSPAAPMTQLRPMQTTANRQAPYAA